MSDGLTEPGACGVAQPSAEPARGLQGAGLEPRKSEKAEVTPPAGLGEARRVDAPGSVSAFEVSVFRVYLLAKALT